MATSLSYLRTVVLVMMTFTYGEFAVGKELATGEAIEVPVLRILMGLLLSAVLIIAAIFALSKRKHGSSNGLLSGLLTKGTGEARRIHVLETNRISQHGDLCLVKHDDCEYLLFVSAQYSMIVESKKGESIYGQSLRGG